MRLDDVKFLDYDAVKQIEWTGNSAEYDLALFELAGDGQTLVLNPGTRDVNVYYCKRNLVCTRFNN